MSTRIDLTGQRFGRLLVVGFSHTNERSKAIWQCICDCGSVFSTAGANLIHQGCKSCGCHKSKIRPGLSFGPLAVICVHPDRARSGTKRWCCECSCGRYCVVDGANLTKSRVVGCGKCHEDRYWWRRKKQIKSNGYLQVYRPRALGGKKGSALVHCLEMEEHLGRPLLPFEHVHHKDGDRANNDIENLEIVPAYHSAGQRIEDIKKAEAPSARAALIRYIQDLAVSAGVQIQITQ